MTEKKHADPDHLPDANKVISKDGQDGNTAPEGYTDTGTFTSNYCPIEISGETDANVLVRHLREELRIANAHIKGLAAKLKEATNG